MYAAYLELVLWFVVMLLMGFSSLLHLFRPVDASTAMGGTLFSSKQVDLSTYLVSIVM